MVSKIRDQEQEQEQQQEQASNQEQTRNQEQEKVTAISPEVFVPEFGLFDLVYLEPDKKYQGRIYRLGSEQVKMLSEALGFTAKFDHSSIRAAYIDVIKTEGHITFEIDRNTKPTDLNLRYMRDRWNATDAGARGADALRPWIKTQYDTRFLPEKVFAILANQLRMNVEDLERFYIRLNLKDRTAGLIAEDQYIDQFPTQPFQVFALPEGHVATVPTVDVAVEGLASIPRRAEESAPSQDSGPKYATYSKSEIDRMLKTQSDNITSALSGKISQQQRIFTEAVEAQEKAFAKITERFATQFEEARVKLESHTKAMQENGKAEMQKLSEDLSRELTDFRAHVNKNILPVSKVMEEKIREIQVVASTKTEKENLKPLLLGVAAALLVAIIGGTALLYSSVGQISGLAEIKAQSSRGLEKDNK